MKFIIGVLFCWMAGASEADKQAPVEIKVVRNAKSATLQINPPAGTHLNYTGPWKFEVDGKAIDLASFDKKRRMFTIAKIDSKGSSPYSLVYFYCAEDNSWCKRAEAKGNL